MTEIGQCTIKVQVNDFNLKVEAFLGLLHNNDMAQTCWDVLKLVKIHELKSVKSVLFCLSKTGLRFTEITGIQWTHFEKARMIHLRRVLRFMHCLLFWYFPLRFPFCRSNETASVTPGTYNLDLFKKTKCCFTTLNLTLTKVE